jgi:diguanylate cyclase (GGDEF)-like protein
VVGRRYQGVSTDLPIRIPPGSGFARKVATFGVPAVAGYLVALVPSDAAPKTEWMAAAGALVVLTAIVTAFLPWDRMPHPFRALPPIAYIGVIALMRMGTGGADSTYIPLLLLPLVWLALFGTRGQLLTGFLAAGSVLFLTGSPTGEALQHSLLTVIVAPAVCFTIQRLVGRIRRQAAMLEDLTNGDQLTGAITRRAWETTLERELIRAARTSEAVTIGFINIDSFHKFNERFGPDAGDDVLRRSVAAWRRELRAGDLLGRIDGDGFGVALPACSAEQAHEVVERLRVATTDLQTCSIGLAQWKKGESPRHFIDRALAALRAAKQQGRDRTVVAGEPSSSEPAPIDTSTSVDVLDSPSLLEGAATQSRSLIAELHAVAEASTSKKEATQDDIPVEEAVTAASPKTSSEFSGATPAATAGENEELEADPIAEERITEATDTPPADTPEDGTPEADPPEGGTPEADSPDADSPQDDSASDRRGDTDRDAVERSVDDPLAVVSKADGNPVIVPSDLDDLQTARGAQAIHRLLRDLSSTR